MLQKKINYFHVCIALCALMGVMMQLHQYGVNMLLYFTTLSNSMVAIYYLLSLVNKQRLTRFYGSVVMAILLTGVVYHFMLSPLVSSVRFHRLENYIVHYIVPISVGIDFLWDKKHHFRWRNPFEWTFFPSIYFVFALVNGLVLKWTIPNNPDSPFPYFFLNVTKLGVFNVVQYAIVILLVYVLFGYVLVGVKKIVKR